MKRISNKYTLPILLIVTGTIWAVKNFNLLSEDMENMFLAWPTIVLAAGTVITIFSRWKFVGASAILTGGVFLVGGIFGYTIPDLWPVALIAVGILSLFVIPFTAPDPDLEIETSDKNKSQISIPADFIKNFTQWKSSDGPQIKFFVN